MPRWSTLRRQVAPGIVALAAGGCTQGGLAPRGSEASRILDVTVWLTVVGTAVALIVIAAFVWAALRRGEDDPRRAEHLPDSRLERRFVIGGGIVLPAVVLAGFFGVQIWSTIQQPQTGEMRIDVVGHRYWWEATYRDVAGVDEFVTANQIHVPVGPQVTIVTTSEDVIHSFWAPELAGKVDLVPGRVARFTFSVDEPGVYEGYCAEYCGLQHTWMKFEVVAMEPAEFEDWAARMAEPAAEAESEIERRGQQVFVGGSCVGCHTIRGVAAVEDVGPDLTHLASRSEIGSGIVPLNAENLTAWIVNAQAIKPGVQMPPQALDRDDLDALVAYLMSLE